AAKPKAPTMEKEQSENRLTRLRLDSKASCKAVRVTSRGCFGTFQSMGWLPTDCLAMMPGLKPASPKGMYPTPLHLSRLIQEQRGVLHMLDGTVFREISKRIWRGGCWAGLLWAT